MTRSRSRAFTLIELLVALAVFAVISVLTLRAISGALDQRAHVEDEARKWRELARLYAALEADLAAALSAPGTAFNGRSSPAGEDGSWLALARAGRSEEELTAIAPRGIRYFLEQEHIVRAAYPALDPGEAQGTLGVSRYPTRVRALGLRYLGAGGEWHAAWPESASGLPRAIELELELATGERIRRVLLVR